MFRDFLIISLFQHCLIAFLRHNQRFSFEIFWNQLFTFFLFYLSNFLHNLKPHLKTYEYEFIIYISVSNLLTIIRSAQPQTHRVDLRMKLRWKFSCGFLTNQINTQRVERKRIDKAFPNPHEQQQQQHYTHTQWELCGNADADWSSAAIYTGVLVFHFNIVWDVFMLDYLIHTGLQEGGRERER